MEDEMLNRVQHDRRGTRARKQRKGIISTIPDSLQFLTFKINICYNNAVYEEDTI